MSKSGAILIIEDDADDKQFLEDILLELGVKNKIIWFDNCIDAYEYMTQTTLSTFIIMCDINLPLQNGLDFKLQLDADPVLRRKSIPFIFYSTSARQEDVNEAFMKMTVQGFFKKSVEYNVMKKNIKTILDYWQLSEHPGT
jgi:CheY-like chemotaxis protein